MEIRIATIADAEAIQRIYAPYVKNTAVTFEYDVPSVDELIERISKTISQYPYFVAVDDGVVVGYAYARSFHSRIAYQHSVEVSIYIDEARRGEKIGQLLYSELEKALIRQNVYVLYACITTTDRICDQNLNDASVRFHEKMGYHLVGTHNLCGYKFDKWYSVIWMEKVIADRPDKPDDFISFSRCYDVDQ